jgi:hypothetical protein
MVAGFRDGRRTPSSTTEDADALPNHRPCRRPPQPAKTPTPSSPAEHAAPSQPAEVRWSSRSSRQARPCRDPATVPGVSGWVAGFRDGRRTPSSTTEDADALLDHRTRRPLLNHRKFRWSSRSSRQARPCRDPAAVPGVSGRVAGFRDGRRTPSSTTEDADALLNQRKVRWSSRSSRQARPCRDPATVPGVSGRVAGFRDGRRTPSSTTENADSFLNHRKRRTLLNQRKFGGRAGRAARRDRVETRRRCLGSPVG